MQNSNEQMNKTKEIPEVKEDNLKGDNKNLVHEDQQSLFDNDNAFTEAMVVEKQEVEINPVLDEEVNEQPASGDTVVFTFPKEKELDATELEGTAKDYYNATHSASIEDKVNELCRLADVGFDEDLSEENEEVKTPSYSEKELKKIKKNRRRGIVSDDDMVMLADASESEENFAYEQMPKITEQVVMPEPEKNTEQIEEDVKIYTPDDEKEDDVKVFDKSDIAENDEEQNEEQDEEQNEEQDDESDEEEDVLIKALGKGKSSKFFENMLENQPDAEYTERAQEGVILKGLRARAIKSTFSVILTVIVAAFCIYFETAAGTKSAHPSMFEPGKFGITYALSMLQLMFFGIIFNLEGMKRAFKGLRASRTSVEGFAAASCVVCTLHTLLSCIIASDNPNLVSLCSVGCIMLVFLSVNSFVKAYTSLTAFCVAASKAPKYSLGNLDKASLEARAFEKYLDSDTSVVTVEKSTFVKGFFKKINALPVSCAGGLKLIVPVTVIAVVAGIVKGVLAQDIYSGIVTFTTIALASFPANALVITALPFLSASAKAKKLQTAYIGEAASDSYRTVGVISFDDTEVFPAKSVKVSSVKTYGENRIDKVILYMAKIFDKLEGPLSYVFANSVHGMEEQNFVEAQIIEHFSDGISVKIEDREVLVGTGAFMRLYDIETPLDNIDESFMHSLGSIMYMAIDGTLAAKFYIKYAINRNFEQVLHSFYQAGICVGIKTLDPCITTELVNGSLRGSNYPVSVIKKHSQSDSMTNVNDNTESAIISLSGAHNFLKAFIKLDNLRNVYRSNSIISIFASIIGLVLSAFFCFAGVTSAVSLTFVVAFQLFWCIPTILFSLLSK